MRINRVVIDPALAELSSFFEGGVLQSLQSVGEDVRCRFRSFLFRGFINAGFYVAPPCDLSLANGAKDGDLVGRYIWNSDFVAAALLAAKGEGQLPVVRACHGLSLSCSD